MATSFWSLINEYKVVIPIIQRDYAQGREIGKVPLIRENILNAMCSAFENPSNPLELDFVYGYTRTVENSDGSMVEIFYPLDGQQRLTTLFLLHWYVAASEGHLLIDGQKLGNFTYEIRHSSRLFCEALIKYQPHSFEGSIKENIINQPWFFSAWKNDPTIHSMLVMLESIQNKIKKIGLDGIWGLLTSGTAPIMFHLLPTDKLGMPDDLYIKMNSRGKELTEFEYFKIRFSELLKSENSDIFNHKIDQEWSDLFWDLFKREASDNIALAVDDGFLRFFNFITDMLIAENEIMFDEESDSFDKIQNVYADSENVDYLFNILDLMVTSRQQRPDFYESIFYTSVDDFDPNKVRIFFARPNLDLFKKCAESYDPEQRNNPFSIGEQLLLYACMLHLQTNSLDFQVRLRKLRNLISNSEDTVRKEYLPSLLKSVKILILDDAVESESKFNTTQVQEEKQKEQFLLQNPNIKFILFKLEDHHLLQGCIAILGLQPGFDLVGQKFIEVFSPSCRYVAISCALFTYGDYTQKVGWKRLLASTKESTWRELFTPSNRRIEFDNTKVVISSLLLDLVNDHSKTIDGIIEKYLDLFAADPLMKKDWQYYFIKYKDFRYHSDGFYYWKDRSKPYESIMMFRTMMNGRHWDPVLLSIKQANENCLSMENFGKPLIFVKGEVSITITNHNDHFRFDANESNAESLQFLDKVRSDGIINDEYKYMIIQDNQGLDIEDRVLRGIEIVKELQAL